MINADRAILERLQESIGKSENVHAGSAKLLLMRLCQRPQGFRTNDGGCCGDIQLLVEMKLAVVDGGMVFLNKEHDEVAKLTFVL